VEFTMPPKQNNLMTSFDTTSQVTYTVSLRCQRALASTSWAVRLCIALTG